MTTNGHHPTTTGVNATGVTATTSAPRPDTRIRRMFRFWLDVTKDDQHLLTVALDKLIRERKFAANVRDALRLYLDLKAGNTAVLFELFPLLKAKIISTQGAFPSLRSGEGLGEGFGGEVADLPGIFAGTNDHVNPAEARQNFSSGFGNLFAANSDDDLWDD